MADKDLFAFVASYSDDEQAPLDYETLKDLHAEGMVGSYDAAILRKDADGKVHLRRHEKPTQHGAEAGVVVGALSRLEEYLDCEITRVQKRMAKEIKGDVTDFEKALEEMTK